MPSHHLVGNISPAKVEILRQYSRLFADANRKFNLTSLRTAEQIEDHLVCQSTTLLDYLPASCSRLLDVGSGGGIPGVPIAICRPEIDVRLIDATVKKVNFINSAATNLNLQNVEATHGRAEELGRDPELRESFDVVTARALAALSTLVEYTLPFLKLGGTALFPKGPDPQREITQSCKAVRALGGALQSVVSEGFPGGSLVIVSKIARTPELYPRRTGIPGKRPIGVPL